MNRHIPDKQQIHGPNDGDAVREIIEAVSCIEMTLLNQIHGNGMMTIGIKAKQVDVKISTNFPSPSIKVVSDQLATHQNNTGSSTYRTSIKLFMSSGLYILNKESAILAAHNIGDGQRNKIEKETIRLVFLFHSYFKSQ